MKCVILARGSGERFWPLSTKETPKQFLKLFSNKTLLRETFERIPFRLKPQDIYIVTNQSYAMATYREIPELEKENVLLEPAKKNTAPACTYATVMFDPEEIVFIVPSDHYIPEADKFWRCVEIAERFLQTHEGIITFGVVPNRVETAYGYIEAGEQIEPGIYEAKKFHEKPDRDTASIYINQGNYFWNSGMFLYRVSYFIEQMKKHAPQVIGLFLIEKDMKKIYEQTPSISIDYALMEKADRIFMVRANFAWSDVGSFRSLKELGVANSKRAVVMNGENLFVRTGKPAIVIGVSDVAVVESEHGILVCRMDQLDKLRDALKMLETNAST